MPTYDERLLFWAIAKRHTNRRPFTNKPVPDELVHELIEAAGAEGAWLAPLEGDARQEFARLVADADRSQMHDPRFRRELASWIHKSRDQSADGMPRDALAIPALLSPAGPLAIRTFDLGKGAAAQDNKLIEASPLLVVLGTDADTTHDRLAAGQALSRVLLRATQDDVAASFLNQPIEVAELRSAVAGLVGRSGTAQIVLRLGYGPKTMPTPRRPVREILA